MPVGTIKKLMDRGFGFIEAEGATGRDGDIYFHSKVVVGASFDELQEGQAVTYDVGPDPRNPSRLQATRVEVVGS